MPIGSESDRDIIRPKHHKAVPGLGVFMALEVTFLVYFVL